MGRDDEDLFRGGRRTVEVDDVIANRKTGYVRPVCNT